MPKIVLRAATADDVGILLELIRGLALYEKKPEQAVATEADLLEHGFGPVPRFEALIAFVDGKPAGFALYFPNFSTWTGRPGLYLEDIFVPEWARKLGVGRRLMARLAAITLDRGWGRFDFSVLNWNPARGFYHRLGFEHLQEWLPYRAVGDALSRLAAEDRG
ncbi:MAG TPA: GNAT family N-acetyltransferase [Stellaceae bacterium]|nr:GNAT family N-acetyltransferase [Stellaceae bacterium]